MKVYITYGIGSNLKDCYSVIKGKNLAECLQKIMKATGNNYAFSYTEEDFMRMREKFPMQCVPLQPHIINRTGE